MRAVPFLAVLAAIAVASCTAPKPPATPVANPPAPVPRLTPAAPSQTDWRDRPLTTGSWSYTREAAGSAASYGSPGAPVFVLRCDPAQHVVTLSRPTVGGSEMTVQTSYSSRTIPAASAGGVALVASLAARDPTLDQMAFSRGRFSLASPGLPTLYLPAWAEPARVIEDCR